MSVIITPGGPTGGGGGVQRLDNSVTLESDSNLIGCAEIDIDTNKLYFFQCDIISNANSNRIRIFVNGETSEANYGKYQYFQSGASSVAASEDGGNNATAISGTMSMGDVAGLTGTIRKFFDGTNSRIIIQLQNEYVNNRIATGSVIRTLTGDVNVTELCINSNQTDGIKAGSFFRIWA